MTPAIQPNSRTWILRFKHHRTTVLLHVDPLQKLPSVRAELLKAVQQTSRDGTLDGHEIPDSESDVLLARPVDINNLDLGWEPLEHDAELEAALEEDDTNGKGKGKGKAASTSASRSGGRGKQPKEALTDCPQGAGLRDGGVVAFKFRSEQEAERRETDEGVDVGKEELEDGAALAGQPLVEKWDVVVPSLDESYEDDMTGVEG